MELTKGRNLKKYIIFIFLAYFGYLLNALYYNGFGTKAPVMMEFYQITSSRQGLIITTQAIGSFITLLYMALYGERYNKINLFAIGLLIFSAGSISLGFAPPFATVFLCVIATGVGFSTVDVMLNGMIPELFPKHRSTLVPLMHAFFGVGAMTAPIIVTALVRPEIPSTFSRLFLLVGALALALVAAFFIISRRIIPETPYADMTAVRSKVSENPAEIFKSKNAWMFLIASALYFSFQIGLLSWLTSYCKEVGMDFSTSGTMLTAFYGGSLVMRFCGPLVFKFIAVRKAYMLFSLISATLVFTALFMESAAAMMALLAAGGFMQGLCVSSLVLMSTAAFPHRVASASSLPFIASSIAGTTAPLWIGALAEHTGFRIPLLIICGFLALSTLPIFLVRR